MTDAQSYYDPKTRSMRDNPYSNTEFEDEKLYRGDNAMRHTGDAIKFLEMNEFAAVSRKINGELNAQSVHLPSNPTLAEKTFNAVLDKKSHVKLKFDQKILLKYGGGKYLLGQTSKEKKLIHGESEIYEEYAADGRIIKKLDSFIAKSKYAEDYYPGQHLAIFGSFYDLNTQEWGYKCCKQTVYKSYCTVKTCVDAHYVRSLLHSNLEMNISKTNASEQDTNHYSAALKPKHYRNEDKKVNPSGYVSTKGILANTRSIHNVQIQSKENITVKPPKKKRKLN